MRLSAADYSFIGMVLSKTNQTLALGILDYKTQNPPILKDTSKLPELYGFFCNHNDIPEDYLSSGPSTSEKSKLKQAFILCAFQIYRPCVMALPFINLRYEANGLITKLAHLFNLTKAPITRHFQLAISYYSNYEDFKAFVDSNHNALNLCILGWKNSDIKATD